MEKNDNIKELLLRLAGIACAAGIAVNLTISGVVLPEINFTKDEKQTSSAIPVPYDTEVSLLSGTKAGICTGPGEFKNYYYVQFENGEGDIAVLNKTYINNTTFGGDSIYTSCSSSQLGTYAQSCGWSNYDGTQPIAKYSWCSDRVKDAQSNDVLVGSYEIDNVVRLSNHIDNGNRKDNLAGRGINYQEVVCDAIAYGSMRNNMYDERLVEYDENTNTFYDDDSKPYSRDEVFEEIMRQQVGEGGYTLSQNKTY